MTDLSDLCDCVTISYAARPVSRHDVNKLQIDDSTLQIDDSTLQIGDSRFRIVDLTLLRAGSDRRLDVTKLRIGDFGTCQ